MLKKQVVRTDRSYIHKTADGRFQIHSGFKADHYDFEALDEGKYVPKGKHASMLFPGSTYNPAEWILSWYE